MIFKYNSLTIYEFFFKSDRIFHPDSFMGLKLFIGFILSELDKSS